MTGDSSGSSGPLSPAGGPAYNQLRSGHLAGKAGLGFTADPDTFLLALVGTSVLFNFLPDKILDENFFFSWQAAAARP